MSEQKKDRKKQELIKKIEAVCNQLSLWTLFRIYLYIKRVQLERKWNKIVWAWLLSQSKVDEEIVADYE
jgi:hypothetical protein